MLQKEVQAKLHLDFGEKDFDWKYSKKTIPIYMPEAELVIRPGFQHCGYMAAHPKEYAEEIEAFIWRNRNVLRYPETEHVMEGRKYGFNIKIQLLKLLVIFPAVSALAAWICTLF